MASEDLKTRHELMRRKLESLAEWPAKDYPRRTEDGYPEEVTYDQFAYERMVDTYRKAIREILEQDAVEEIPEEPSVTGMSIMEVASGDPVPLTDEELAFVFGETRHVSTDESRKAIVEAIRSYSPNLSDETLEDMAMLQMLGGQAMFGRLSTRLIATLRRMRPDLIERQDEEKT